MKLSECASKNCTFSPNREIKEGDDIIVVWIHRGMFPIIYADLISDVTRFTNCHVFHSDCVLNDVLNDFNKILKEAEKT